MRHWLPIERASALPGAAPGILGGLLAGTFSIGIASSATLVGTVVALLAADGDVGEEQWSGASLDGVACRNGTQRSQSG